MLDIKKNIPLKNYTTFRIGGPAKFFVEVETEDELIEALQYAKENNLEFFILGGGSNLLVSNKGYDGIVIKFQISSAAADKFQIPENIIEAEAGASLAKIVQESAKYNLTGLEWAAGIPGTIGGAVRGNAGAFGSCMKDAIQSVKAIDTKDLGIKIYDLKKCEFEYRSSVFKENKNLIILSAVLKLEKGNKEEIQNKIKEIIEKRSLKHLKEKSAGSFFKNPIVENKKLVEEFKRDQSIKCKDNKISAGWLIDQVGLRGKKIGGAKVSEKHANFIVNTGEATAEDVIILASFIKQQIRDKFGIELKEEVQYIGFNC